MACDPVPLASWIAAVTAGDIAWLHFAGAQFLEQGFRCFTGADATDHQCVAYGYQRPGAFLALDFLQLGEILTGQNATYSTGAADFEVGRMGILPICANSSATIQSLRTGSSSSSTELTMPEMTKTIASMQARVSSG